MAKRKAAKSGSGFARPMDDYSQGPHVRPKKKKSKSAKKAK